jgi:hypothetical protein
MVRLTVITDRESPRVFQQRSLNTAREPTGRVNFKARPSSYVLQSRIVQEQPLHHLDPYMQPSETDLICATILGSLEGKISRSLTMKVPVIG